MLVLNNNTTLADIICGVPPGFILGPLLLLIHVDDLKNASNILVAIIFTDDIISSILIATLKPFLPQ